MPDSVVWNRLQRGCDFLEQLPAGHLPAVGTGENGGMRVVNQPTVRRTSTSGRSTERPWPPRSTMTLPLPTVAATARPSAASSMSSAEPQTSPGVVNLGRFRGGQRRRHPLQIVDGGWFRRLRAGHVQGSPVGLFQPVVAAFQHRGMRRQGGAALQPLPPRGGDRFEQDLLAGGPLAEGGEDVGEQDVAGELVTGDAVQTQNQVGRTTRRRADVGRCQRRTEQVTLAHLVGQNAPDRCPLIGVPA